MFILKILICLIIFFTIGFTMFLIFYYIMMDALLKSGMTKKEIKECLNKGRYHDF